MRDSRVLIVFILVALVRATSALNVTVGTVTCSNITVSWTTMDNRTADFTIHYNSTVHSGTKNLTMDASSHDHHTTKLTDLVAATDYNITVTTRFDNDSATVSDTVTVKTELGTPFGKAVPYRTSIGSTSLSFKVRDRGGNATYDCWINSTDHRLYRWTQGSNTTVSGLDPGTYYNITCQKRPKMKSECYTGHRVVATKPNPPANMTITQTTCNSVTVNWTQPAHNGNVEITGYKVHVYKDSNDSLVHTNTTMMSYEVTSLEPKTDYTVEVRAGNVGGFGNGTTTNFTTKETGRMLITVLAQSTSVNVTINGSGEEYSCTLNDQTVNITSGQTFQQTGLAPSTNYTINCHSVNDSCLGARATFTTEQRPGVVSDLMSGPVSVSEDGGSIQQNISWQPPVSGDVMMYLIRYGMGDSNMENATSITTPNISIELTLSVPDGTLDMVVYNIWVAVVTKSKELGKATELTIQYRTPGPPRDLQVEAVSCSSIQVSWLPPNSSLSGGLPLISYKVRYNGTDLHNISRGEDKLEADIPELQPNTLYTISVSANNTLGWGEEAKGSNTTMPRLRVPLFNVTEVKSKSLTMTVMMRGSFKDLQCETSPNANGMRTFTLTQGNEKQAGLTPNTQYTIHCVGKDEDGRDVCIEQTMNVTTRKNPPGQVTNVRRDGESWVEGGRIYQPITWDEPRATEDNEVPETYVVRYRKTTPNAVTNTTETTNNKTTLVLSFPLPQQAVTYIVSVAGKADTEPGNFSDELTLQYSRPGAPTGVTVQALSCHTLKVAWSSPNHTGGLPITGYNISYTDTQNNNKLHEYSNTTMMSLQQLKLGAEYTVRVRAMNPIGEGDLTQQSSERTSQRREGYVIVTANSAHSIHLSHNLTESGVYYLCNVTEVKGEEKKAVNKRVTKEIMNVTGLLPDTTYRVDCVAYRSDGVEACVEANTTVTTRPDRVQNVIVTGSTVQSVHSNDSITIIQNITWDGLPNHHNIQHYLIKNQMQGQPTSSETRTSSNATQASLVLLVPKGQTSTYSVWMAAVSEAGQGEFSERVDFNYSKPDPPTGVKAVNSTCNSIRLTWSAPHYTGGVPLEGYAVRWRGRGLPLVTDEPDVTALIVTRLSPNTSYSISVTAVNAIGEGEQSQPIMATTTSQAKSLEVTVSTTSSTSLHITTQPLPGLEMVEVNCNLTSKDNSSYIRSVSLDNTRDGGAQRLTDNLVPYTNYTATCLVFKDGVDQCYIGSDTTQTYTDIPSGPPERVDTVSTSSHSFTMTWAPPPKGQQNGEIVSYEVEYREEDSNSTVVNTTQGMRYTAEDLTTDRVYQFRVAANTVNGTGPFSEWENVTTIPTVTNLKAVNTTTNSTTIMWDQPPHNYTVFLHGEATDNIPQSRFIPLVDVTGQTTHIVQGLNSFRNYSISVFLTSNNGNGSVATVIVRTTGREPTAHPQNVSVDSTSSHSFTLMWAPPPKGQQNGEIVSYEVEYREEGSNSTVVNTTQDMRYTAEDLTPDRVYQFRVAANTVNGTGPFSEWENVTTIPRVTNLTVINTTTNSITITWDQPPYEYTVFLHGEATDNIPQSRVIQLVNVTGHTTHIVEGLNSFRNYSISVFLAGDNGNGSYATVTFQTYGQAPDGSPIHLRATPTRRSVTLQWSPPPVLSRNGILTHYVVGLANETWNTTQSHRTTGEQRKRREADSEGVGEETQSLTVWHLRPFTTYTWEVAAVSDFGAGPSSSRRFETDQDVPTQVEDITVNPDEKTVTWAAPAEPNGIIVGYRVQYWELGRRDTAEEANATADKLMFLYDIFSAGVPHKVQVQAATVAGLGESRVVKEVLFSEEQAPAVPVSNVTITRINDTAVRVTWMRLTLNDARGFPSYVVSVTSKGKEAVNHSTNSTSVVVEGLLPHTEYNVTVRALTAGGTKGGPRSTPVTIKAKPTEEPTVYSSPLIWILAVLIAVLMVVAITFIVIVAVICIRWRYIAKLKGSDYWETIPMTDRRMMDEATPALTAKTPEDKIQRKEAILRRNFCVYVQKMHQDKNGPFLTEYQNITHTPDYVSATVYQSNMIKNRYINVFPYDHCRVVLKERDSTGSDYINATYIDAYNRPNGYIATQGPTSYTLDDFWQMVWEHHAPVIVMLTKLAENSKIKCERYWETALNEPFKPGRDLSVTTLRCDTHPEFELRTIKVEKLTSKEDPLEVKHFLYTAWPDHGVPQYSISIHRFIRQHVRPVYNDSSAPLILHCSAGAGRTGTYMAIDTMMYQLEDRQNANIFEYVERMRTRRTQMVQNASQYIYIHDAINDYINCKDTTIVAHELRPRIEEMRQIDITTGSSGFVTQFSLLEKMSIELCGAEYAFAEQESITSRNRYITRFPYSDNYITDEEGNYINASDILGYNGQKNFIAAQAPMKHTETDVWGMICNENCTTVVVLCNFVEENEDMCSTFWPLKRSEPKEFNNITVCLEETDEQESYNTYRLIVTLTDDPDPLKVVVFHYLQWPRDGRPSIPPYLQLMGEVEGSQHNATGPTLVMCDDGMSRTGVFITTMAEVERVKVQGEVDIFQTVKAARSERPHMVSTPVDYEVCHDVLLSYLESFDTYANFK